MPTPVSATSSKTRAASSWTRTAISPARVNLNAFDRRLVTIFSHMSRSTQGGAEFVGDVAEESGLCAVQGGQGLGPLRLRLVRAGVGDDRHHLSGGGAEESPVAILQRAVRTDPRDQESVGLRRAWMGQGQD